MVRSTTAPTMVEVVLDQQHGHAPFLLQGAQHVGQLLGLLHVEAGGGLVGQQQDRLGDQGPGQLDQAARPESEGG